MDFTRKGFLGTLAAVGLTGASRPSPADRAAVRPSGPPRLRFGVLSDIHVTDAAATAPFEAVLRELDDWGADGVMVCGDLSDYGVVPQLEEIGKAWFRAFPGGRGRDGRPIANLMHFGDHDTNGFTWRNCKACVAMYPDEAEMRKLLIAANDRKAAWERIFGEEWSPILHRRVRGYDFVLANFTREHREINPLGDCTPGLGEFLAELKPDPGRPFFYSQHRIFRNTVCGPHAWGQDDGSAGRILSEHYPNAIAFCGHGHYSAMCELNVWQGGFTAFQVPSLRYCTAFGGRENASGSSGIPSRPYAMRAMDGGQGRDFTRQGYLVEVFDNCMVVKRREFKRGVSLGPDWIVPFPACAGRPYAPEARARTVPAPEFPAGAKAAVRSVRAKDRDGTERKMFEVSFPLADAKSPVANDYEIRVEHVNGDVANAVSSRRYYPGNYFYGLRDDLREVVCRLPESDVPEGAEGRLVITPLTAFGRRGEPLVLRLPC